MEYFKSDGKNIYLEAEYAEFYIPITYFGNTLTPLAEDRGQIIHAFGVFPVRIFTKEKKEITTKLLNLPTWIDINAADNDVETIDLPHYDAPVKCRVIKFLKGACIMPSTVVKDSSCVEAFLHMVLDGKVPNNVPVDKAAQLWHKNMDINGTNLGVPSVILELILSKSYRYKEDPTKTFAVAYGKNPSLSMYDYIMNNVRDVCRNTSTYSAITYQDIDSMMVASVNRSTTNNVGEQSPVEQILKL